MVQRPRVCLIAGAAVSIIAFLAATTAAPARMPELPFDIPSRAALASSPRQVLAYWHMFPRYWRNNSDAYAAWLSPTGDSKYYKYGGKFRTRPIPVSNANLTHARRVAEMYQDISDAAAIGIDAFMMNVPYGPTDFRWKEHLLPLYDAADQFDSDNSPGFKVAIDLSAFQIRAKLGTSEGSPQTWADRVAPFMERLSYYKYKNKPVIGVYHVTQLSASWYQQFANRLEIAHGKSVYIFPSYQGNDPSQLDSYASLVPDLMPFLHTWSNVSYTTSPSSLFSNFRDWAGANGVEFMGSVKHNVHRPDSLKTIESNGFETMQNMWLSSIQNNDGIMKILSWNDHLENHHIRPDTGYQQAPYDITAYYITWFKTGSPPTIVRDVLYYAHRMHHTDAKRDTRKQPGAITFQLASQARPVDKVIALTFLKAPATLRITSEGRGSTVTEVPAGVSLRTAPLYPNDRPKFSVTRQGTAVIPEFYSAFETRGSIVWQDLQYRMGSSSRPSVPAVQNNLPQDR